jgi:hypothetical protein
MINNIIEGHAYDPVRFIMDMQNIFTGQVIDKAKLPFRYTMSMKDPNELGKVHSITEIHVQTMYIIKTFEGDIKYIPANFLKKIKEN